MTTPQELFHARERRKSLLDPTFELFRTHQFLAADNPIDVSAVFPVAGTGDVPVTVAWTLARSGTTPTGVIWEIGASGGAGVGAWVEAATGDVLVAAGDSGADLVTLRALDPIPTGSGAKRFVYSLIPGTGAARLWVNGELVALGAATGVALSDGWVDGGDGAVGDIEGTMVGVSSPDDIALADADIIGPVSLYLGQRPRQF